MTIDHDTWLQNQLPLSNDSECDTCINDGRCPNEECEFYACQLEREEEENEK